MFFIKQNLVKTALLGINIIYVCIFIANWIYEITASEVTLRLITSRVSLFAILGYLVLSEWFPKKSIDLFKFT
jgi:hypothetical protein